MEQPTNKIVPSEESTERTTGRRDLLKAIAATGGAVTAVALLPGEWAKPMVEIGHLPAHAQISLPPLKCVEVGDQIDVMLAVDRSGSVGQDLNNVKVALNSFVDGLDLTANQVGLVSFETPATLDHPLTQDSNAIKTAINALTVGDLTNIAGAIHECDAELTGPNHNPGNQRVIILMSDGRQTVAGDPIAEANAAKNNDIHILSVAVGFFADFATLQAIATSPDDFYFAPASIDLITIFDPECSL